MRENIPLYHIEYYIGQKIDTISRYLYISIVNPFTLLDVSTFSHISISSICYNFFPSQPKIFIGIFPPALLIL